MMEQPRCWTGKEWQTIQLNSVICIDLSLNLIRYILFGFDLSAMLGTPADQSPVISLWKTPDLYERVSDHEFASLSKIRLTCVHFNP